ncbi:hypothetical protein PRZ48_014414 [Zasmidium cellare]|uniref:Myb-like DNA-binding domain-containing protein n=1 Tax=Zasmidium cellare TaxID=395010 RepID=A0ABR0DY66_ZASCE|nr:hypothetical protein PRZ48_014414 [Zasmidium cellare]
MSTPLTLNARQQALLVAVIRNMTAEINWDAVATEAGYPTAKSARDNWGHTRKKIESSSGSETTPAKATPKKRKGDDEKTPSKKKSKKVTPPADKDDEEESKGEDKPEAGSEDDEV